MAIKILHIARIHTGTTLIAEYDDVTFRVRAITLTASRDKASIASYDEVTTDKPIKRELSLDAKGESSQVFDSASFKVDIEDDSPFIVNGRFRLN